MRAAQSPQGFFATGRGHERATCLCSRWPRSRHRAIAGSSRALDRRSLEGCWLAAPFSEAARRVASGEWRAHAVRLRETNGAAVLEKPLFALRRPSVRYEDTRRRARRLCRPKSRQPGSVDRANRKRSEPGALVLSAGRVRARSVPKLASSAPSEPVASALASVVRRSLEDQRCPASRLRGERHCDASAAGAGSARGVWPGGSVVAAHVQRQALTARDARSTIRIAAKTGRLLPSSALRGERWGF